MELSNAEGEKMHITDQEFRLMMQNIRSRTYESTISLEQDLTLWGTSKFFEENGVAFGDSQMEILGITHKGEFTNLGYMLSDQFECTVKLAVYRWGKSSFVARKMFGGSVLNQFIKACEYPS